MTERLTLTCAALLLAAVGLSPLVAMLIQTLYADGHFSLRSYQSFLSSDGTFVSLMGHSLLLSFLTAGFATVIGVPLGVLLGKSNLPFRRPLAVAFTLPLLLPPFVSAVAWSSVFARNGWFAGALPPAARDLISSAYFGLPGCVWVLTAALMPLIMLLTMVYLRTVSPRLEDAARLVCGWPGVLRGITLPLIAPAILFASILVFLLTLGEVGVPAYLRYPVYASETLTQFAAFYDFAAATVAAMPLLLVTLALLALQYPLHSRVLELSRNTFEAKTIEIDLGRWRRPLFLLLAAWAAITVLLPFTVLVLQASQGDILAAFTQASDSMLRGIVFAFLGACLLTAMGFYCGYLVDRRSLPFWRAVDGLSLLFFTIPGTVIGIGLISLWNRPVTSLIYASPAIIILGYLAQYAILPIRTIAANLERIPVSLEQAARLSGARWFMTLDKIIVPMAKRGLIAAWVISYIFCLRDLGISMVVYPPGSDTLPVRIFTLMANGAPSLIAALCLILVASTLLPLGLIYLWLRRSRDERVHD